VVHYTVTTPKLLINVNLALRLHLTAHVIKVSDSGIKCLHSHRAKTLSFLLLPVTDGVLTGARHRDIALTHSSLGFLCCLGLLEGEHALFVFSVHAIAMLFALDDALLWWCLRARLQNLFDLGVPFHPTDCGTFAAPLKAG